MNRRQFIGAGAAGSLSLASMSGPASSAPPEKPNLLFIWTDEQRADTMAVYGNKKIRVPNLNKLASESYVFQRAYITQPVSTPSRCSVMTGLWPHQSGCVANNIPLRPDTPCLNELVADPEYRTAYMGKWHLGDEIFAQHGFEEWVSMEDGYWKYYREHQDQKLRSSYHHFLIEQ
ncbi:MAG: sulfatase-like hydrolase/transferase, partial [Armatimonadota bacterium]